VQRLLSSRSSSRRRGSCCGLRCEPELVPYVSKCSIASAGCQKDLI
jgi:hypothetical protein